MAYISETICTYPGCTALVRGGPRCDLHPIEKHVDRRGTANSRGYDHAWQKVRKAYLTRHPICEIQERCDGVPATMVDHKIPVDVEPALRLRFSNLQAACHACNTWKGRTIDPKIRAEHERTKRS